MICSLRVYSPLRCKILLFKKNTRRKEKEEEEEEEEQEGGIEMGDWDGY